MTLSALEVHNLKQAPPVEGVLPAVLSRWSPRSFADHEVSPADLAKVFEAARWSASAYNAAQRRTRRSFQASSASTRGGRVPHRC
jgi:nitroreductase